MSVLRVPCDDDLRALIADAADDDDRTMASWIRTAIREKLKRQGVPDDNQSDD